MTIQFYVEVLKLSCIDQSTLDDVAKQLNDVFKTSEKELAETEGHIHEYLGLPINFSKKLGMFTMYDYIESIIGTTPLNMNGTAPDPPNDGLFVVDKSPSLLYADGADFFHSMTALLLFAAKRARPGVQVAVAYLYIRVREPTMSDYVKLSRIIKYGL